MTGERGMWYKFNPFEWSVRVPLVVAATRRLGGHRVDHGVSLVDLLPTLLDLATTGDSPEVIDPIDGHSLVGMLDGGNADRPDEVTIEFLGEGMFAPALILRKNGFKVHPLRRRPRHVVRPNSDPDELQNLCGDSAFAVNAHPRTIDPPVGSVSCEIQHEA